MRTAMADSDRESLSFGSSLDLSPHFQKKPVVSSYHMEEIHTRPKWR